MRRHIEVLLRPRGDGVQIREVLRQFAETMEEWTLIRFVEEPNKDTLKPDVVIELSDSAMGDKVQLGFVSSQQQQGSVRQVGKRRRSRRPPRHETTRLVTVLYQSGTKHDMQATNAAVKRFVRDVRTFARSGRIAIQVNATSDAGGLPYVIPATQARLAFERYLAGYPHSGHPADDERLNYFICSVSRYAADVNPDELARYLREDHGWSREDASELAARVWHGLDLLRVNRRFGWMQHEFRKTNTSDSASPLSCEPCNGDLGDVPDSQK